MDNTLVDNGLFDTQRKAFIEKGLDPDKVYIDIQQYLKNAGTYLDNNDFEESDYNTSLALRAYEKALYTSSKRWRFTNVYAGPMWIYLIGFLVAVLSFYYYQLDENFLKLHVHIQEVALHATTWGTVGAILRGLWFLKDKVSDRKYRNSFMIYFLSAPFLGGLFGAIIYFILISGLFIVAPTEVPDILNQTSSESGAAQIRPAATTTAVTNTTVLDNTPTNTATTDNATTNAATTDNATTNTTVTNTTVINNTPPEPQGTGVTPLGIIPFAALAGFNWEWAIMLFKRIGDTFKSEAEPDSKLEE